MWISCQDDDLPEQTIRGCNESSFSYCSLIADPNFCIIPSRRSHSAQFYEAALKVEEELKKDTSNVGHKTQHNVREFCEKEKINEGLKTVEQIRQDVKMWLVSASAGGRVGARLDCQLLAFLDTVFADLFSSS